MILDMIKHMLGVSCWGEPDPAPPKAVNRLYYLYVHINIICNICMVRCMSLTMHMRV